MKMHFSSSTDLRIKVTRVINLLGNDKIDAFRERLEGTDALQICQKLYSGIMKNATTKSKTQSDSKVDLVSEDIV
jgi:hypothetical protein